MIIFEQMLKGVSEPTMARIAGYSLEQMDAFLGKLGRPVGIASYKPHHSSGEGFLHNYFGMIGIPIALTEKSIVNLHSSLVAGCHHPRR